MTSQNIVKIHYLEGLHTGKKKKNRHLNDDSSEK